MPFSLRRPMVQIAKNTQAARQLAEAQQKTIEQLAQTAELQQKNIEQLVQTTVAQQKTIERLAQTAEAQQKSTETMVQLLEGQQETLVKMHQLLVQVNYQVECMELRDSMNNPSAVDCMRHLDQEAQGQIWCNTPAIYSGVARLLTYGISTKGQLPLEADQYRGEYGIIQALMAREGLLSDDPLWNQGNISLANPRVQARVIACQPQGSYMTSTLIDEVLGISPQLRDELNQAIARARPSNHETGEPVAVGDAEYMRFARQMAPMHQIQFLDFGN